MRDDMTCDGMSGLGPCTKKAKYDLVPFWALIRKQRKPVPRKLACGIHLQQLTTAKLADREWGQVVVSAVDGLGG